MSLYVGGYVLEFFGISIPVLRVAGGLVIALSAWNLLNADDSSHSNKAEVAPLDPEDAERMAFYPLTMPITAGPGTISVAVSLGNGRRARHRLARKSPFFRCAAAGHSELEHDAAVDPALLHLPEDLVDALQPVGRVVRAHLALAGELQRLLLAAPKSVNNAKRS